MAEQELTYTIRARDLTASAMQSVNRHLAQVSRGFTGVQKDAERADRAISGPAGITNSLRRLGPAAQRAFSQLAAAAKQAAQAASEAAISVSKHLAGAFQDAAGKAKAFGLALSGVLAAGFTAVGVTGVRFNLTLNQAQMTLARVTGSARTAASLIAALRKESETSASTFQSLLPIATQLAVSYGPQGLGKVLPTIRAFGDTAAALGIGQEGIERAMMGFRQLLGRDTVQQEELNQISENLPGLNVAGALQRRFGARTSEGLQDRGVTGPQAAAAIVEEMQRTFGGFQKAGANTLPIILSNFQDAFEGISAAATKTFLPALTRAFGTVLEVLQGVASRGNVAKSMAVVFDALGKVLEKVAGHAEGFFKSLEKIASADNITFFLIKVTALIQTVGESLLKAFGVDLERVMDPKNINKWFTAMEEGVTTVIHWAFGMGRVFSEVLTIIQSAFVDLGDRIGDFTVDTGRMFKSMILGVQSSIHQLAASIIGLFSQLAEVYVTNPLNGKRFYPFGEGTAGKLAGDSAEHAGRATALGRMQNDLAMEGVQDQGTRAARQRRRMLEDPFRGQSPMKRIADAFAGTGRDVSAEAEFFARMDRNQRAIARDFFGRGPAVEQPGLGLSPRHLLRGEQPAGRGTRQITSPLGGRRRDPFAAVTLPNGMRTTAAVAQAYSEASRYGYDSGGRTQQGVTINIQAGSSPEQIAAQVQRALEQLERRANPAPSGY